VLVFALGFFHEFLKHKQLKLVTQVPHHNKEIAKKLRDTNIKNMTHEPKQHQENTTTNEKEQKRLIAVSTLWDFSMKNLAAPWDQKA